MQRRIPIKNPTQEIHLITRRSLLLFIFILILFLILICRLAYLQIYKHDVYTTLSTKNWQDLVPVEPTRGLIYDRNGVLIAENIPVFSLDIIPNQVSDLPKTLTQLAKMIAISDSDLAQFRKQLKQHRRFDEIPLKLRLSEDEVARFAENQYRFPGVLVKARLMRYYPFAESFSHVLGYLGRINTEELNEIDPINYSASHYIGKLGIEKYYEDELHGKVGYEQVENDATGKQVRVLKEIKPIPGKNIYLTIDSKLQLAIEKALTGYRAAIVVIQPATGQILAMVSEPSYDPNLFVTGISQADYQNLQTAADKPLFNRALRGLYPPASTVKPYYALQGLDTEVTTPEFSLWDPGWYQIDNNSHRFHDWWRPGHGKVNIAKAIISSCDTYFYDLAYKMGINRLDSILTQFGFGAHTGVDLEEELPGVVASPDWKRKAKGLSWYKGDTVMSGIGQGYMLATPLQLAAAVSTLANRGSRFMPYLLLGEQSPNQTFAAQQTIPLENITLRNPKNWDVVIKAMQDVILSPRGTAHPIGQNLAYTIAAKTGTAQVYSNKWNSNDELDEQKNIPEKLRSHSLFIAFAPVDKPKIALAIIVENSHAASSIARQVFDYYLTQPKSTIAQGNEK